MHLHACTPLPLDQKIPEILVQFQEGGGGGISRAGAAAPAKLTPPRLCGAPLELQEERRLRAPQTCVKVPALDRRETGTLWDSTFTIKIIMLRLSDAHLSSLLR
ncbi:unnamed protein product [Pleuronectes platessa]|uniref:Uncharacterized protein n=1 Tax=Pleuronectes platessa TaxID=8262 RepID=A0A9N7TJM3_PLEPL|nr:unnamed protein product [Pleuronectes platessa]